MHKEILNEKQLELLPMMARFKREYYLVGGTAIALHIGHRRSIDFDMFKFSAINHKKNLDKIDGYQFPYIVTRRVEEQMNLIINEVKVTFFQYPFHVDPTISFDNTFRIPTLLQLAAMKAYALGRRSKWKDYVDLYFLLTQHFSMQDICTCSKSMYGELFSEKMFRSQLCFFDDIDYSEQVDYILPNPPSEDIIKSTLVSLAIEGV